MANYNPRQQKSQLMNNKIQKPQIKPKLSKQGNKHEIGNQI